MLEDFHDHACRRRTHPGDFLKRTCRVDKRRQRLFQIENGGRGTAVSEGFLR